MVRHVINRKLFDKGLVSWSKTRHKIVDKTAHSYTLDNKKAYQYFELEPANITQTVILVKTRAKDKEPTFEQMKKANTIKRRLKHEGVELDNILKSRLRTNR